MPCGVEHRLAVVVPCSVDDTFGSVSFSVAGEVGDILENSGVAKEKVEVFKEKVKKQFGEDKPLKPQNIIESKKFEVVTPQVKISVAPEFSYLVETKVVEGRKYIMIPADETVEINGVSVKVEQ